MCTIRIMNHFHSDHYFYLIQILIVILFNCVIVILILVLLLLMNLNSDYNCKLDLDCIPIQFPLSEWRSLRRCHCFEWETDVSSRVEWLTALWKWHSPGEVWKTSLCMLKPRHPRLNRLWPSKVLRKILRIQSYVKQLARTRPNRLQWKLKFTVSLFISQ